MRSGLWFLALFLALGLFAARCGSVTISNLDPAEFQTPTPAP